MDRQRAEALGDIASTLSEGDQGLLSGYPTYLLREGDALWLPCGHMPIVVGIESSVKFKDGKVSLKGCPSASQWHVHCLAVHGVMSDELIASASAHGKADVETSFIRRKAWLPEAWVKGDGAKKWLTSLGDHNTGEAALVTET